MKILGIPVSKMVNSTLQKGLHYPCPKYMYQKCKPLLYFSKKKNQMYVAFFLSYYILFQICQIHCWWKTNKQITLKQGIDEGAAHTQKDTKYSKGPPKQTEESKLWHERKRIKNKDLISRFMNASIWFKAQ